MNGQAPQKREWKDVVEEVEIRIHNEAMQLEIDKAVIKDAEAHARGQ